MSGKGPLKITVELPPEAVDIDVRSVGELAGMDRWSFMRAMREHGVPVIAYSAEDLRKDVATLESL